MLGDISDTRRICLRHGVYSDSWLSEVPNPRTQPRSGHTMSFTQSLWIASRRQISGGWKEEALYPGNSRARTDAHDAPIINSQLMLRLCISCPVQRSKQKEKHRHLHILTRAHNLGCVKDPRIVVKKRGRHQVAGWCADGKTDKLGESLRIRPLERCKS